MPLRLVPEPHPQRPRLRLDDAPSWVAATEVNAFVWPGYDLRLIRRGDSDPTCLYGYLPSRFLGQVQTAIQKNRIEQKLKLVPR